MKVLTSRKIIQLSAEFGEAIAQTYRRHKNGPEALRMCIMFIYKWHNVKIAINTFENIYNH